MTVQEAVHGTETVTPNGTRIYFQSAPKRLYRVNDVEVPSVTEVLSVIDKSGPLIWWGQGVGVSGTLDLIRFGRITKAGGEIVVVNADGAEPATQENVVPLLTEYKISTNHQRDKAGDRGTSIHKAFEAWAEGLEPDTSFYSAEEQGYINGLIAFLKDVHVDKRAKPLVEVMVGSVEHGFAGRYDLQTTLKECELVTNAKKGTKEVFEKGRWLIDLKTSRGIWPTHEMQLAAYELASVECGFKPTVGQMVVRVDASGTYEVKRSRAAGEDFLAIKSAYEVNQKLKKR